MNWELPYVQAGFRKGRRTRYQISNIPWIIDKGIPATTSTSALLFTLKPLTLWITTNCGQSLKLWVYQTTWSVSWETYMQSINELQPDMEQLTGWKLGKTTSSLCIVTLIIWLIWIVHHVGCQAGWITCKNQDCLESILIPRWYHFNDSKEELKSLLKRLKKESERASLKLNTKITMIMISNSILQGK